MNSTTPESLTCSELDQWFASEILPHEGALTRYLRRAWVVLAEVPDLRQEVYVRVYESAAKARPGNPKSFLFRTARNLIIDRIRHERVVSIEYSQDLETSNVSVDEFTPERRISARQELCQLAEALDALSDDCRNVIWLRRVEGLSQREAAERLDMLEGTVESHLCRGIRSLAAAVFGVGNAVNPRQHGNSDHEAQRRQRDRQRRDRSAGSALARPPRR
jgi:RNA polymerase sigma factor (sigma-70 family)